MDQTRPKRLWNIQTMKVEMYDDIRDDVEDNGYVCVSHVWGDQQLYPASQFGIISVNWDIPLSNPNKVHRLKEAMQQHGKKYCWFDVLCMPQNKQDEINLEIPLMGDYYSGADMTLVLSAVEHSLSDGFVEWNRTISDIMRSDRRPTVEEYQQLMSDNQAFLDADKEAWFTRVWTLQEAVLSKKLVLVDSKGLHIVLTDILDAMSYASNGILPSYSFIRSNSILHELSLAIANHKRDSQIVLSVLGKCTGRKCYKIHDKFYGALGILKYKDFLVSYDIPIEKLNMDMAKYAYSKGDVSWVGIGGNVGTGFIQPMYDEFTQIGVGWAEKSGGSGIKFEDEALWMNTITFGTIAKCRRFIDPNPESAFDIPRFVRWFFSTFRKWGFDDELIAYTITGYLVSEENIGTAMKCLDHIAGNTEITREDMENIGADITNDITDDLGRTMVLCGSMTIAMAISDEGDERYPLVISGNTNVGDKIMLTNIGDMAGRTLGIITGKFGERKGIFLFNLDQEIPNQLYVPHKFVHKNPKSSRYCRIL